MCGTFGQKKLPLKKVKLEFLPEEPLVENGNYKLNLNTWTGYSAGIIANDDIKHYTWGIFGFHPHWSKDKRLYLFNARIEGKLNETNAQEYCGEMGIWEMPSFKKAIRAQRCVIPMDFFVEGPEKEKYKKPYLIRRKDQQPFFVGGIWENFVDKSTGEIIKTFSILTTSATPLLKNAVGHHRSPLILNEDDIPTWLDNDTPKEVINQLLKVANTEEFEAYPIDASIVKSRLNNPDIENPIN